MQIRVKYQLFKIIGGNKVSEGDSYQIINVDDNVNMDDSEGLQIVRNELAKEIGQSASDIKILNGSKL